MSYSTLNDARLIPATIQREGGKEVLVQEALINAILDACRGLESELAKIPSLLEEYGLKAYCNEVLQREIIKDGSGSVWVAVAKELQRKLEAIGYFSQTARKHACENADEAVSREFKKKLDIIVGNIRGWAANIAEVNGEAPDFDSLKYASGKLRLYPKFTEAIRPRFTTPVPDKAKKLIKAMREAAKAIQSLKEDGAEIDLVLQMAGGSQFSDEALLSHLVLHTPLKR